MECGVVPSERTIRENESFLKIKDEIGPKIKDEIGPRVTRSSKLAKEKEEDSGKDDAGSEDEDFVSVKNSVPSEVVEIPPPPAPPAPPASAPPKLPERRRQVSKVKFATKQRALTPPPNKIQVPTMSVSLSENDAVSTISDFVVTDQLGSLFNPEISVFSQASEGQFANGYHVYHVPKLVKGSSGYPGIFVMKCVHPNNLLKYSASIATEEYMRQLRELKRISEEQELSYSGILLKCPTFEAGDRVGKSSVIKHSFPCKETKEHVKSKQALFPPDATHHTLILIPDDLDNRVFSLDDLKVEPHYSCPAPTKQKTLGDVQITHFHVMWRIAFRGQGFPLEEEGEDSLADVIKKFQSVTNEW